METMILEVDKQKFIDHVRRICRNNIKKPCRICLTCPFRDHVLRVMKEQGWKLPENKAR